MASTRRDIDPINGRGLEGIKPRALSDHLRHQAVGVTVPMRAPSIDWQHTIAGCPRSPMPEKGVTRRAPGGSAWGTTTRRRVARACWRMPAWPPLIDLHTALGLAAPKGRPIKLSDVKIDVTVGKATHNEVFDRPLWAGTLGAPQDALVQLDNGCFGLQVAPHLMRQQFRVPLCGGLMVRCQHIWRAALPSACRTGMYVASRYYMWATCVGGGAGAAVQAGVGKVSQRLNQSRGRHHTGRRGCCHRPGCPVQWQRRCGRGSDGLCGAKS